MSRIQSMGAIVIQAVGIWAGMGAGIEGRAGMEKARGGVTRGRAARQEGMGASDGSMQGIKMRIVK